MEYEAGSDDESIEGVFIKPNQVTEVLDINDESLINGQNDDIIEGIFQDPALIFKSNEDMIVAIDIFGESESNPQFLVTGGMDDNLFFISPHDLSCVEKVSCHKDTVVTVEFDTSQSFLLTADLSGLIYIWQVPNWKSPFRCIETDKIQWCKWHNKLENYIICGLDGGSAQIWNVETMVYATYVTPLFASFDYHTPFIVYGHTGNLKAVLGCYNGHVVMYEDDENKPVRTIIPINIKTTNLSIFEISPEDKVLACVHEDSSIVDLYSLPNHRFICRLNDRKIGESYKIECLLFMERFLVTGGVIEDDQQSGRGFLACWDLLSKRLFNLRTFESSIVEIKRLDGHEHVFCGFSDGQLLQVSVSDGVVISKFTGHYSSICFMKYSSKFKLLISADLENTVSVHIIS